jgi:hypothetical protein
VPDIEKTSFERLRARLSRAAASLRFLVFVIGYLGCVIGGFALSIWVQIDLRIAILMLAVGVMIAVAWMALDMESFRLFLRSPIPSFGASLRALLSRSTDKTREDG